MLDQHLCLADHKQCEQRKRIHRDHRVLMCEPAFQEARRFCNNQIQIIYRIEHLLQSAPAKDKVCQEVHKWLDTIKDMVCQFREDLHMCPYPCPECPTMRDHKANHKQI